MLLTKYKVQELVDSIEIRLDDLEKYSGVKLDDDSAILVSNAIEMLKEGIADEVYGGYRVYNGERMLEPIKEIILGLVEIHNNTPLEHREIMNGTRIVDYYKRKGIQ